MLRRIYRSLATLSFIFMLSLFIRSPSFAQTYGPFYSAADTSGNQYQACSDTGSCSYNYFNNNCSALCTDGHQRDCLRSGDYCATQWNAGASCISTNYNYPSGPQYSCSLSSGRAGLQFYIPAPSCSATYGGTCTFFTDCTSPSTSYPNTSCNNPNGLNSLPNVMTCCVAPPPPPKCSDYGNCGSCVSGDPYTCGWNGSSCSSGTSSCPAGQTQWYWTSTDCATGNNRCAPPTPNCDSTPVCAPACSAPVNTCSANNGTQTSCNYTTYSGGGTCNQVAAPNQPCTLDNCSSGYTCTSGTCVLPAPGQYNLSGHVFIDTNQNGVLDPGETDFPNPPPINLSLSSPNGGIINSIGSSDIIITSYWMRLVTKADYSLALTVPTGYKLTTTNPVNITNISADTVVNFGIVSNVCTVTTSPSVLNLSTATGEPTPHTGTVTATVTNLPAGKTITQMLFGAYPSSIDGSTIATITSPDATSPYSATVTGVKAGSTAAWATAQLSDGDTIACQTTGATDTDINVTDPGGAPTPTTPPPSGSVTIQGRHVDQFGNSLSASTLPTNVGQRVSLTDGSGRFTTASPAWSLSTTPGSFNVTAQLITGYTIYNSPCLAPCAHPDSSYSLGNSRAMNLVDGNVVDIYFKYSPATYSIRGRMFNDTDGNGKSTGNPTYTGPFTVTSTGGTVTKPSLGNYLVSGLAPGPYTVTFSGPLTAGYSFTYPTTPGNSLIVTVGPSCSVPGTSEASCSSGNVINLHSGVSNLSSAWIQSVGSDLRWDSGFNNPLPSATQYSSVAGSGGTPGVIFSGASTPCFGVGCTGKASADPFNWQVGGPLEKREVFTDTHTLIPTSYRFLLETVDGSNIAKKTIRDLCNGGSDPANCILTPTLQNAVYWIDLGGTGTLNLNGSGYTFPAGTSGTSKNFVILINGNLKINERILLPANSTAIFSAKGDITVNDTLGEAPATSCNITTHAGCDIEGLYSADGNFYSIDTPLPCTSANQRLNIAGTVIANAGRIGGSFINNRTLCAGNATNPSVTFTERPDFMLNYPSMVKQIPRSWQEIAP